MLVITVENLDKITLYFEKADKGENIIVQRGKDEVYALNPESEYDLYFNAEMVKKIRKSIR